MSELKLLVRLFCAAAVCGVATVTSAGLPHAAPEEVGLDSKHLARIDEAICEALEQ
jgi:hypothetical protein